MSAGDLVLEPSAGTGMMAVFAHIAGARMMLNEYAELRAKMLEQSFGTNAVTRFDAATIHDRLDAGFVPSLVVMNPPFSATPGVEGRFKSTTARHVRSALLRLAPEGRLVVITGEGFCPTAPAWRETFRDLQTIGRVVFTAGIAGKAFAAKGARHAGKVARMIRDPGQQRRGTRQAVLQPVAVIDGLVPGECQSEAGDTAALQIGLRRRSGDGTPNGPEALRPVRSGLPLVAIGAVAALGRPPRTYSTSCSGRVRHRLSFGFPGLRKALQ